MDFESIKTKRGCRHTLKEIESLKTAERGRPEDCQLDALVASVKAWEIVTTWPSE